jgi:segregation and condensation protein B
MRSSSIMLENNLSTTAALEALLYIYGEAMPITKAAKMLNVSEENIQRASQELEEKCKDTGSGLTMMHQGDTIQLATKPELSSLLENIAKGELTTALTPAAIETLAIIAYAGPMPRSTVDYIRGVNSSFIVRSLMMRGLVARSAEKKSNAYSYTVSGELLKHLGLTAIENLPEYETFREMVKKFNIQMS